MGSGENLTTFDEPLRDSVIEQPFCGEVCEEEPVSENCAGFRTRSNPIGDSVNDINLSDGCPYFSNDDKTCYLSSDDVRTTAIGNRDHLLGDCTNVVCLGLEDVLDDECGVSGVFLNENQFAIGVCNSPDRCLDFSQDISSNDVTESVVGNRDLLASDCENLAALVSEKNVGDECGVCLTENKSEVDVCSMKIDGLCLDIRGFQGDKGSGKSLDGCEMLLGEMPRGSSPRNHDLQDEKMEKEVDASSVEGIVEVVEEKTYVLPLVQVGAGNQTFSSEGCRMSLGSNFETGSSRNFVLQHDCKDDKIVGCLSGDEGVLEEKIYTLSGLEEVMDDKSNVFVGTEKDICKPIFSLQDSDICLESTLMNGSSEGFVGDKSDVLVGTKIEFPVESVSSTGFSSNYAPVNEQNTESISPHAVEGKDDASAVIEANMCNRISCSQDVEIPSKCSCKGDLMRRDIHNDPSEHNSFCHLAVQPIIKVMETRSDIDTRILALSVHSCQSSVENLHMSDSLSNYPQQNEQRDNRIIERPSAESITEFVEEKSDVTTDKKVEICTQVLHVEEGPVKKSVSLPPCHPFSSDENDSSKLDVTDPFQKDVFGDMVSISAVDGGKQADHEEQDNVAVDCFSKTENPDTVPSFSKRSSIRSRLNRKTQTKRAAKNYRNTVKEQEPQSNNDIIFKVARRKRSCLSKPARASIWGLLDNITHFFYMSDVNRCSQAQNQRSRKAKGGRGSQKQKKKRTSGNSLGSSRKSHSYTRCLRLKVKVGKEVCQGSLNITVPEVVDTTGSDDAIVSGYRTESYQRNSLEFPKLAHSVEGKSREEGLTECFIKNAEEAETHPDDSVFNVYLANKDLKGTVMSNKFDVDVTDEYISIPAHKGDDVLGGAIENCYMDPGTSPDSEVINLVPDAQVGARSQEELHKTVSSSPKACVATGYVICSRRGKKEDDLHLADNRILEESSLVSASKKKAKPSKKREGRQKMVDNFGSGEMLVASFGANASSISSGNGEVSVEPLPSSTETELGIFREEMVPSIKSKGCRISKTSKSDGMRKGKFKVSDTAKNRRKKTDKLGANQRKSVNKSKLEKGVSITKRMQKVVCDQVEEKTECKPEIGSNMADDVGKSDGVDSIACADVANEDIVSGAVPQHDCPNESAWVLCDDCCKWRRIPVALANSIDENCRWVCKDNLDKAFADCSASQEKTNADINAELGLSDYEEDVSDGLLNYNGSGKYLDFRSIAAVPGSAFRRINSNVFLHRSRKTQTIDEIMVCHCKPPLDSRLGCGDECLNRMLNIECVKGTCPCGDRCSNQQFQKRKYANMRWLPCGKKGFGLHSLENISIGHFIIEYVGEVLDMHSYEARQKKYAANGHKHFYFMTLNGSEVIDACAKGNLGRFINHSCDPNCRTEKWMVNGEICIGLFALRDIKEGEELTFDYNYVRVFGAAAKKCHCGSSQCRGYIGGDPQNTEVIYQGDSDDEYPEPVMLEDGEAGDGLDNIISKTCSSYGARTKIAETIVKDIDSMDNSTRAIGQFETASEIDDRIDQSASAAFQLQGLPEIENSKGVQSVDISQPEEDETSRPISAVQPSSSMEEKIVNKVSSVIQEVGYSSPTLMSMKSKSDTVEDKRGFSRSLPRIKTSHSSSSVKKGKVTTSPPNGNKVKMMANKPQHLPIKPKKSMEGSSNGRFEAVQEKLNELLDADGGLSKRKDAAKGYLKLLLLTAASGNSGNGEAIQSNRDLSMILDAILKTKSRMVLKDVIDKNGLQMLHNIMKQYKRDFKKIPILRKLLKVLEYLASRKILTQDHITGGPPRPGIVSLKESILSLTEHDDRQVHQIARNFRDTWIPKSCRKSSYMDRDDSRMDFHRGGVNCNRFSISQQNNWHDQSVRPSEAIDCVKQSPFATTSVDSTANEVGSAPCTGGSQTNGTKTRKRKSRWDQPAETNLDSGSLNHKEQKIESRLLKQYESGPFSKVEHTDKVSREDSNCPSSVYNNCNKDETISSEDGGQITQDDIPPGFSSPLDHPPLGSSDASSTTDHPHQNVSHLKCPFEVAIGYPQGKFISRLPVSYGIPLHILEQFGSPQAETVDSWVIAPALPFHPFPPLPPSPCDNKDTPPASTVSYETVNGYVEDCREDSHCLSICHPENNTSTTGANQSGGGVPDADTEQTFKRMKGSSNDLGKRFFRQQKFNKGPPWLWKRNELRSSYCSQDIDFREDKPCSNFYQRPPQQNHH
ncbi:hypothetical protein LWI28_000551 [Acer negundo]|uniref:Histone-lysine N-methyltransferase ASHH2-like n=1 Tax=Acer negundo TaxID=4023 RepID=A0AAD5P510_ACENE|nr:hypothetical protein LWI28_000551 [Acer negundo]